MTVPDTGADCTFEAVSEADHFKQPARGAGNLENTSLADYKEHPVTRITPPDELQNTAATSSDFKTISIACNYDATSGAHTMSFNGRTSPFESGILPGRHSNPECAARADRMSTACTVQLPLPIALLLS